MDVSRRSLIAIIITTSIASMAVMYFYMSGGSQVFGTKYLTQISQSVSGLTPGSRVEYNGLRVGRVVSLKIDNANPKIINVVIDVEKTTPVTQGTVAGLSTDAANLTFVALMDDGKDLKKLATVKGQKYPVIKSQVLHGVSNLSSLDEIAVTLKQLNSTLQEFFTADNIESFKQMLYSMQVVMGTLAENNQQLKSLIVNTEKASNKFDSFIITTQSTMRTLQGQTLPATYRLMSDLEDMLNRMTGLMAEIQRNPAILVRGKAPLKPGPGE